MKSKKPFSIILFTKNAYKSSSLFLTRHSIPKQKPQFNCPTPVTKPILSQYTKPIYNEIICSLKTLNNDFRFTPLNPFLQTYFFHSKLYSSTTPSDPPNNEDEPIDAGSSIRKPISLWPGMYHSPVTNALWEARSNLYEPMPKVPSDDNALTRELIAKPPSKSRTSVLYKFSTDYALREQYRNPWNRMRMGKLVEDLDALAGTISFKVLLWF